jgi:hypothetical protein
MATYTKFNLFVEELAKGSHQLHAAGHTLKVALSNVAPTVATDADLTDITQIAATTNGYAPADIQNDVSRTGSTLTLTAVDVTFTQSGTSAMGPFRYIVIYNDDASDKLVCFWDYGSEVTLTGSSGETFVVDFDGGEVFDLV